MLLGHKLNIRWMSKPCTQKADYSAAWHKQTLSFFLNERKSIDTAEPSLHRAAVQNHRIVWKEKSNLAHLLADCQDSARRCGGQSHTYNLDCNVRWMYSYWLSGDSWDRKFKGHQLPTNLKHCLMQYYAMYWHCYPNCTSRISCHQYLKLYTPTNLAHRQCPPRVYSLTVGPERLYSTNVL